ncbi:MAG: hypothetical protein ABIV28_01310 [Longimicrobiales bacterium]
MNIRLRYAAASIALALCVPAHAFAQTALQVTADPRDHHAMVRLGPVLASQELQHAAIGGLPIRLRVRTELWRDGFFDDLTGSTTWSAVLVYEPLRRRYFVRPLGTTGPARSYDSYELARNAIEGELPIRLRPERTGRYYYTSILEIETLSVSDLQELERWLQGELQPAVEGEQSIPGAIGQGAKRLLIRVLGVPNRRVEARSEQFRVSG